MRHASIDLLRTVAIALMVIVHFLENLSGAHWSPGDFGAPLFTFLVGVNYRLWARSQEAKGVAESVVRRVAVRRGLFLFALGMAFNFFVWLPEDTFNWDVLTLIGTALVVLAFARGWPGWFVAFGCAVAFTLAPFLRLQADYTSHWPDGSFECDLTLPDILVGYLATGYFPLFPWLVFPLAGYVAGTVVFPDPADDDPSPPSVRPAATAGVGLILLALGLGLVRADLPTPVSAGLLTGWTMFPASVEYVTGTLGLALLAFAVLHVLVDRRRLLDRFPGVLSVAGTMSRYSLTVYLLHHVLHLWPLWVYGAVAGDEPTHFWRGAMPAAVSVPLAAVCLVACYWLFREMARREWPGVESVMRWVCD